MGKNIVILADGTGQRSGLFYDENRSNIYKLYRATRCGPDLTVHPNEQLAFYDPGIGTRSLSSNFFVRFYERILNLICQATGLGLTGNTVDCYAAIIRKWQPGDKIFLFGFSRGAYTIRTLAAVLSFCGVPTQMPDGKPLLRDKKHTEKIAKEAVKRVYQHTRSIRPASATPRQKELLEQRERLAAQFRRKYKSGDEKSANAEPFFIGAFDTVSSIARLDSLLLVSSMVIGLIALLSWAFSFLALTWTSWLAVLLGCSLFGFGLWYCSARVKMPGALPGYTAWQTCTCNTLLMNSDDMRLSRNVPYARHAISIDEDRKAFPRVGWGTRGEPNPPDKNGINQFEQVWFAGNHSDIGGSYAENEARLSDISLKWMVDVAEKVGLKYDARYLNLYPCPYGKQHDERRSFLFRLAGVSLRQIDPKAVLHPSVLDRFKAEAVLHYDEMKPYRPKALRGHEETSGYY